MKFSAGLEHFNAVQWMLYFGAPLKQFGAEDTALKN